MVDELVRNLATRVGVSTNWRDQTGEDRIVSIGTLRHILISLGYPAENEGDVRNALSALDAGVNMQSAQSHFVTARVNQPVALPVPAPPGTTVEVTYESGATRVVSSIDAFEGSLTLPPFDQPGYHSVHLPTGAFTIATAPERCISFLDLNDGRPGWGAAAQVYSLRTQTDCGAGDFGGVAQLARGAGRLGADLLGDLAGACAVRRRAAPLQPLFALDAAVLQSRLRRSLSGAARRAGARGRQDARPQPKRSRRSIPAR